MSKTFCPLPWIHLATRPNGDVRVCCTANASGAGKQDEKTAGLVKKDGIAMNLRDHTIEEVWIAGLAGIAIEYNEILIISFDEVIAYANKKGLFIAGI